MCGSGRFTLRQLHVVYIVEIEELHELHVNW